MVVQWRPDSDWKNVEGGDVLWDVLVAGQIAPAGPLPMARVVRIDERELERLHMLYMVAGAFGTSDVERGLRRLVAAVRERGAIHLQVAGDENLQADRRQNP